jgi:hypothetical protein
MKGSNNTLASRFDTYHDTDLMIRITMHEKPQKKKTYEKYCLFQGR